MKEHFGKNGYSCLSRFWLTRDKKIMLKYQTILDVFLFIFFLWSHENSTFLGFHNFLFADTQLYKSLCPSVRPLNRLSVRPSIHP